MWLKHASLDLYGRTGGILHHFHAHNGFDFLMANWHAPVKGGNILKAVVLGFSAAMLGISGFESSANFVEEHKPSVFPKTLRYIPISTWST